MNDDIAVGGFGLELDNNNMRSLNLDSGIMTPSKQKPLSSPLKRSREKSDSVFEEDLDNDKF